MCMLRSGHISLNSILMMNIYARQRHTERHLVFFNSSHIFYIQFSGFYHFSTVRGVDFYHTVGYMIFTFSIFYLRVTDRQASLLSRTPVLLFPVSFHAGQFGQESHSHRSRLLKTERKPSHFPEMCVIASFSVGPGDRTEFNQLFPSLIFYSLTACQLHSLKPLPLAQWETGRSELCSRKGLQCGL